MKCQVLAALVLLNCFVSSSNFDISNGLISRKRKLENENFIPINCGEQSEILPHSSPKKPRTEVSSNLSISLIDEEFPKPPSKSPNACSDVPECRRASLAEVIAELPTYELIQWFKSNYAFYPSIIRSFPRGIAIFSSNKKRILKINGDELNLLEWNLELNYLEFVRIENFFDEIHISKLPLDKHNCLYFYQFIMINASRLSALSFDDCEIEKNFSFQWKFPALTALSTFKWRGQLREWENLDFLLLNLPVNLKTLEISSTSPIEVTAGLFGDVFERLSGLQELKIENIEDYSDWSVTRLFALKHLYSVQVGGYFGENVICNLRECKANWTFFSIKFNLFSEKNLENLPFLVQLKSLALECRELLISKVINFFASNASFFPHLSLVEVGKNCEEEALTIPDSLAKSKIKFNFNYNRKIIQNFNWQNYLTISTGVLFNFLHNQEVAQLIVAKARDEPRFFAHLTRLTFYCRSREHLQWLIGLLNCMPQLKFLHIIFEMTSDEILQELQANFHKELESLHLTFLIVREAEQITKVILSCFSKIKKLTIQYFCKFNILQFDNFPVLPNVEEISIEGSFNVNGIEHLFFWFSLHSKLRLISVHFCIAIQMPLGENKKQKFSLPNVKKLKFKIDYGVQNYFKLEKIFSKFTNLNEVELSVNSESNLGTIQQAIPNLLHFTQIEYSMWNNVKVRLIKKLKHGQ